MTLSDNEFILLLEDFQGEWWIQNGQAIFADDMTNHELLVIDDISRALLDSIGVEIDSEYTSIAEYGDDITKTVKEEEGIELENQEDIENYLLANSCYLFDDEQQCKDAIAAAYGHIDPRDYAMKYLGWIRVAGKNVQMWHLTRENLKTLCNGLYDAKGDEPDDDDLFHVEVMATHKIFYDIPYEILKEENPIKLAAYRIS